MRRSMLVVAASLAACGGAGTARPAGGPAMPGMESAARPGSMPAMPGMTEAARTARDSVTPIHVTSTQAALAGVTFTIAREAPLERTVRAVAMVAPNERGLGIVNARVTGWVEKLYVNETGRYVRAGEPLLELYAPELVTAEEELLLALRMPRTAGGDSLVAAARRRLKLWEISDDQIADLERSGTVRRTLTLRSPYPGNVTEKDVIEGQMVHVGDVLYRIADLSTVWVEPAIFENDISQIHVGQRATATFDAAPRRVFGGRVTFVYPELEMRTRTLKVRVEIPNPGLRLKPMMYGTVQIRARAGQGVVVPLTAVLPTGERDLAFVVRRGAVIPTPVTIGAYGDSSLIVTGGLAPGDTVVASATFLFDSESSLAAAMKGIMLNMGMGLDMGGVKKQAGPMPGMPMSGGRQP